MSDNFLLPRVPFAKKPLPSNQIVLSCEARYGKRIGHNRLPGGNTEHGELAGWTYAVIRRQDKWKPEPNIRAGVTAAKFWDSIDTELRGGGTWWCWAWWAWEAFCLLRWRAEIDRGAYSMDSSPSARLPAHHPRRLKEGGSFIFQDPPTLIDVAKTGGGRLRLIDPRNLNLEPGDWETKPGETGDLWRCVRAVRDYQHLVQVEHLGEVKPTLAAQSWTYFRSRHLKHKIEVPRDPLQIQVETAAYWPGRCECRRIGKVTGPIYHYDYNSLYTSLGVSAMLPTRLLSCVDNADLPLTVRRAEERGQVMIGDVTIDARQPRWPAGGHVLTEPDLAPAKRTRAEKVIWPLGQFRTILPHAELVDALDRRAVKRMHQLWIYEAQPLLKSWAEWGLDFRERVCRSEQLSGLKPAAKGLLNSLTGKFGQRGKSWMPFPNCEREVVDGAPLWSSEWTRSPQSGLVCQGRTISGYGEYEDDSETGPLAVPSISACWVSLGRIAWLKVADIIGWDQLIYSDTDGFMMFEGGSRRLANADMVSPYLPGKLKLVEVADEGFFAGLRRYRLGKRWVVSGVKAHPKTDDDQIVEWTSQEGLATQLGHKDNDAGRAARVERHARLCKSYRHGTVDEAGNVSPLVVFRQPENIRAKS